MIPNFHLNYIRLKDAIAVLAGSLSQYLQLEKFLNGLGGGTAGDWKCFCCLTDGNDGLFEQRIQSQDQVFSGSFDMELMDV